jgi:hypothetical protein
MPSVGVKKCGKCGKKKRLTEFYPRYDRKGYRSKCKECFIEAKKLAKKNPEKYKLRDVFLGY